MSKFDFDKKTQKNLDGLFELRRKMELKLKLRDGFVVHSAAIEFPGFNLEFLYEGIDWIVNVQPRLEDDKWR